MSNPELFPRPNPDLPYAVARRVRDTCLCFHVERAARALARRFDKALRPLGLRSGQFSLLMSLNRPEPPSIGAVAAILVTDHTTLTANLKPLERRGLVEVRVDAADKRSRRLILTPAGRALLLAALPVWERTHEAVETSLPRSNPEELRADLRSLSDPSLAAAFSEAAPRPHGVKEGPSPGTGAELGGLL